MPRPAPPRSRRSAPVLLALLLAAGLLAPVGAAQAGTDPAGAAAAPGSNPGRYANPLLPEVPGDGAVESCADPTVIRSDDETGTTWYMYCTTDPLNDEDLDAAGDLVFHRVPTMTSRDLVDWTYVGDAFDSVPSWADPAAALWAPEVTYSTEYDRYYMFVGVTNTSDETSGEPGCDGDNAIGVATSDSPTGPWTFSDEPVVGPRRGGDGCNFQWTYDPDVLGDSVGTESVLYYGSYYGGVYGAPLTLTADGASVSAEDAVMVALDNKYEGANVVERNGWYYLFVSATNCCNGALTGYSVFVGRSRDPLGTFVDQQGNSLVDAQTGGTPFLISNGNRWVGTGHNTVFQDAAGDWWTIYHAVDQADPFFETSPGFTKRPALLDAIDWVQGWPTVNGGSGPSDAAVPAPAGQVGERSRHRPTPPAPQEPHKLRADHSDDFSGTALSPAWSWDWTGEDGTAPALPGHSVSGGLLAVDIQRADTYVDVDDAYVLVRDAPRADYVVEARVRVDVPDEGCCFNYAQAGIMVYGDEDAYVKLTNTSIWNTRQTEWSKEIPAERAPEGWSRYGNTVVGPPSEEWTYLRIAVERLTGAERKAAGGDTEGYTAYTSQDGETWVRGGTWTHSLGRDARIGLAAFGQQPGTPGEFTAEFDHVRVYSLR